MYLIMRKVVMLNRISVDGYFASLNEETSGMDWFIPDSAIDKEVRKGDSPDGSTDSDTLLLGRKTFELFEHSWVPYLVDSDAPPEMQSVAQELTNLHKIVFSTTMRKSKWKNTEFFQKNPEDIVRQLKRNPGGQILIFGSGSIVKQLTEHRLIDEYQFILTPVIAGYGKPLFPGITQLNLKLMSAETFDTGNILLRYTQEDDEN
jgi:dihydrofolate reductase